MSSAVGVKACLFADCEGLHSTHLLPQKVLSLRQNSGVQRMVATSSGKRMGVIRAECLPSSQEAAENVPGAQAVTLEEVGTDSAKPRSIHGATGQ